MATVVAVSFVLVLVGCGNDEAQEKKAREQQAALDAYRQRYLREHPQEAQRAAVDLAARQKAGALCVEAGKFRRAALSSGLLSAKARIRIALVEKDSADPGDVPAYEARLPSVVRASGPSATHVLCVAEKRTTIEVCRYGSGSHSVERTRAAVEVTLVDLEARTAALGSVQGAEPEACPFSVQKTQSAMRTLTGPRVPEGAAIEAALGRQLYDQLRREDTRVATVARRVRWVGGVKDPKQLAAAATGDSEPEVRAAAAARLRELGGK